MYFLTIWNLPINLTEFQMSLRDQIADNGYEDVILFENPDYESAFIGISTGGQAVYSFDKMVDCLMTEDEMTEEEAIEFIEYNTIGSIGFEGSPIVVRSLL